MITSTTRGAILSPCGLFRYRLWRAWDERLPRLLWCMLNPSTADHEQDDPTVGVITEFSRRWGYGGLDIVNLYAFRTPSPAALKQAGYPVGPDNDLHLRAMFQQHTRVIAGWGANAQWARVEQVEDMVWTNASECTRLEALARNANGSPKHPLYVSRSTEPTHWSSMA